MSRRMDGATRRIWNHAWLEANVELGTDPDDAYADGYLEGAAVAFGIIGMAQAINSFVAQREKDRIYAELAKAMMRAGQVTSP